MNEENERVVITVVDKHGVSTRIVTDEAFAEDTAWPHLVEVFLEQLQGLGYKFFATPAEMVDVLEEFHQDLVCSECNGCDEEKTSVEEKKYPYTGVAKDERGTTVVRFVSPKTGTCIYKEGNDNFVDEYAENWAEDIFQKVSK